MFSRVADRFGHVIEWNDRLDNQTLTERNAAGQLIRETGAGPDDGGSLTSPNTVFGYDTDGDLVYQENPDESTKTRTYTSTFHQVASATDNRGNDLERPLHRPLFYFSNGVEWPWLY